MLIYVFINLFFIILLFAGTWVFTQEKRTCDDAYIAWEETRRIQMYELYMNRDQNRYTILILVLLSTEPGKFRHVSIN